MEKCLIFDIWGDYGHFRKFYTTSSPLTHAIPPKTAIWGMIGAIIGLDKTNYLNYFQGNTSACGVKIINPIRKTRLAVNLIDTKQDKQFFANTAHHTQVIIEFLKRPKYRIYFSHIDQSLYNEVKRNIQKHCTYYTLCLGLSECLAQFEYIGEYTMERAEDKGNVTVVTVIPLQSVSDYKIISGYEYYSETVPAEMDPQRRITRYQRVLYERNGKPINCILNEYYRLEMNENVLFL